MKITTLGIDLVKNVFQLHGVDGNGRTVLRKRFSRGRLLRILANLESCVIGIEACGGAYLWARSVVYRCDNEGKPTPPLARDLKQRRGANRACVALANKDARIL